MVGKGQRRRQKNFVASHGGDNRLPPPPKPKDVDAIPFKLRRLMELQKQTPPPHLPGGSPSTVPGDNRKKRGAADGEDKRNADSICASKMNLDGNNHDTKDEVNGKKKKRKRKAIADPQIQKLIFGGEHRTKRQRKKEYLDARKKNHKKPKEDSVREFPGRENVKFGEVVDAPPKLSVPKALKMPKDASKERLRLQAVEAYRNQKGWASRPGINLPSTMATPSI